MTDAGDPRRIRSREAILAAAGELLLHEGPTAVTHQRVAAAAGVGRATVYRHWPAPERLLLDVMARAEMPFFRDPQPPIRPWLFRQLRQLADELALPTVRATTLTLMQGALWDTTIAAQRDSFLNTLSRQLQTALTIAERDGEIKQQPDADQLPALLIGPLVYRTAMETTTVSDAMLTAILDSVLPNAALDGRASADQ